MAQNSTQPKSFRITEETANKLKEIATLTGKNQQDTLAMLIQVYEFQEGKEALEGKKDEIERFEGLITSITRLYMNALEDGKDAMTIARSQLEAQLLSKDQLIQDLQERCRQLQEKVEFSKDLAEKYEKESQDLSIRYKKLEENVTAQKESYDKIIETKEELLQGRSSMLLRFQKDYEESVKETERISAIAKALETENDHLKDQTKALSEEQEIQQGKIKGQAAHIEELNKMIKEMGQVRQKAIEEAREQLKEQYQIKMEKEIFALKKSMQEDYIDRFASIQQELDSYKEKYFQQLEKNQLRLKE